MALTRKEIENNSLFVTVEMQKLLFTACEIKNLKRKKIAFSETLVLFSTYICQFPHEKSKYLVEGIKS